MHTYIILLTWYVINSILIIFLNYLAKYKVLIGKNGTRTPSFVVYHDFHSTNTILNVPSVTLRVFYYIHTARFYCKGLKYCLTDVKFDYSESSVWGRSR